MAHGVKKGIILQLEKAVGGGEIYFYPEELIAFGESLKPFVNDRGWVRCKLAPNQDAGKKLSHHITGKVIAQLSDPIYRERKIDGPTHFKQAG